MLKILQNLNNITYIKRLKTGTMDIPSWMPCAQNLINKELLKLTFIFMKIVLHVLHYYHEFSSISVIVYIKESWFTKSNQSIVYECHRN